MQGKNLRTAALAGDTETLGRLLDEGIDPNAADASGWTALMLASKHGRRDVLTLLLQRGAEANRRNQHQKSALDYAVANQQPECVDQLLQAGAAAAEIVVKKGVLPGSFAIVEYEEDYPVVTAVKGGFLDVVEVFGTHFGGQKLPSSEQWQKIFNECLLLACRMNQYEMAELLLSLGANVNTQNDVGVCPLLYAASHGNVELMQTLLNHGADVNGAGNEGVGDAKGFSPLVEALAMKRGKAALLLIENGADVQVADKQGMTPLLYAERHQMKRVITAIKSRLCGHG